MSRDRKVHDEEVQYLGPVAVAMFIDVGFIRDWPLSWSAKGLYALRNGVGRWNGQEQNLPRPAEPLASPAAHWEKRRSRVPVGTNIPLS